MRMISASLAWIAVSSDTKLPFASASMNSPGDWSPVGCTALHLQHVPVAFTPDGGPMNVRPQ